MKKYRVFVHGKNFAVREQGSTEPKVRGFYTTVYVEGPDESAAENAAVVLLQQDAQLLAGLLQNDESDPPILLVEEIQELETFNGVRLPRAGFAFYEHQG